MKVLNAAVGRSALVSVTLIALALFESGSAFSEASCRKVSLTGEVTADHVWRAPIGQGWQIGLQPLQPGEAGYSGWDLIVDREQGTGYPDALLLATPPYNSINEREIGTTFGLRAQDAIGWTPRAFHFLIDPAGYKEAQRLFLSLEKDGQLGRSATKSATATRDMSRLMQLQRDKASGELRIVDSRLTPGISDAAPFAEAWALAGMRAPHQIEPAPGGKSSPRGSFHWMRFSITLWLPANWKLPADLHGIQAACTP